MTSLTLARCWRPPSQLISNGLKILSVILLIFQLSTCQYYSESKICAVLHQEQNFQGQEFTLKDSDQSIHLERNFQESASGWNMTGSISIENGCQLEVCNEPYFDGTCHTLTNGLYPTTSSLNVSSISSASCTCFKECKCSDIFMKKSSCARAYHKDGCSSCDTFYTDMDKGRADLPYDVAAQVKAFRLRKGCSLTLYSEEDYEGEEEIIEQEIVEDYSGDFMSYKCECDDNQFEPWIKPPRPASYPPLVKIPETLDDVVKMLTNKEYSNHPGLRAAQMSLKNGRASKNAYLLVLGTVGAGKGRTINMLFDNPNITETGTSTEDIREIRIPVPIDEIGIENSELRIIDTPGLADTRGIYQDVKFLASLDFYLSNHEELKDRIPNVVLILHKYSDNRFDGEGTTFVKMLRGLNNLRSRITDESYSNVIFVMTHFCSASRLSQIRPDARLSRFKSTIESYSLFPKPINIVVAENKARDHELPKVNGYFKLPNFENYPRNLFEKLELITQKGGDMIGLGVFQSAFRNSDDFNISYTRHRLLEEIPNIQDYYYMYHLPRVISASEVSKLLEKTWDEKLDVSFKRKFPHSLGFLQQALYTEKIYGKNDLPKTTNQILKLLRTIKRDVATRELLKQTFNIEAPLLPHHNVVGFGYTLSKDKSLPTSPLQFEDAKNSDIEFLISNFVTLTLNPGTKQFFHVSDTREQYIQHRLESFGIEGIDRNASFEWIVKPGYNIRETSFKQNGCSLSTIVEFRLFELLYNKLTLTQEFQDAVISLPIYNGSDPETVDIFREFFAAYGTHVVRSLYGGGSIDIQLTSEKPCDSRIAKALFDLIRFVENLPYMLVNNDDDEGEKGNGPPEMERNVTNTKTVLSEGINHSVKFMGGDSTIVPEDLDLTKMSVNTASKLVASWKESLKFNPTVLTTEIGLLPISPIAMKLGRNYSFEIDKANPIHIGSCLKRYRSYRSYKPGLSRQDTPLLSELLQKQVQSNKEIQEMIMELKIVEEEMKINTRKLERNGERANRGALPYCPLQWNNLQNVEPDNVEQLPPLEVSEDALLKGQDAQEKLTLKLLKKLGHRPLQLFT